VETSNFPEDVVRENLLIGGGVNVRIYKSGRMREGVRDRVNEKK